MQSNDGRERSPSGDVSHPLSTQPACKGARGSHPSGWATAAGPRQCGGVGSAAGAPSPSCRHTMLPCRTSDVAAIPNSRTTLRTPSLLMSGHAPPGQKSRCTQTSRNNVAAGYINAPAPRAADRAFRAGPTGRGTAPLETSTASRMRPNEPSVSTRPPGGPTSSDRHHADVRKRRDRASTAKLARISHQVPAASAKRTPSRAVLAPRSSTRAASRGRLRRSPLRSARSDARLTLSRRGPGEKCWLAEHRHRSRVKPHSPSYRIREKTSGASSRLRPSRNASSMMKAHAATSPSRRRTS